MLSRYIAMNSEANGTTSYTLEQVGKVNRISLLRTTSRSLARSLGVSAGAAPSSTSGESFARSRFHTPTENPHLRRRRIIALPRIPAPAQPMVRLPSVMVDLPCIRSLLRVAALNKPTEIAWQNWACLTPLCRGEFSLLSKPRYGEKWMSLARLEA